MPGNDDGLLLQASLVGSVADARGHTAVFTRGGTAAAPGLRDCLRIWAISDIHIRTSDAPPDQPTANFNRAIADANGLGCELAILNGDLTHQGAAAEYTQLQNCLGALDMPWEGTTGNHEFLGNDGEAVLRQRFLDLFHYGATTYGSHIRNGVLLVRVCTELANANAGYMRTAQLDWLSALLAAHPDRTTVIFMHQPLQGSVAKSDLFPNFLEQTPELRGILSGNPQVKLILNGHTHQRMTDAQQWVQDSSGVWVAGGASTAYRREYTAQNTWDTSIKRYDLEESPVLEIYPDRMVVRGRRHQAGAQGWVSDQTLTGPTTYTPPVLVGGPGEVLKYNLYTPPTYCFVGRYLPLQRSDAGTAPATLLHVSNCDGSARRSLTYLRDQQQFRFAAGAGALLSAVQTFRSHEPLYFAAQISDAVQRLYLRVGDRGAVQAYSQTALDDGGEVPDLYLGNTPDGQAGLPGTCALELWSAGLTQDQVLARWADMAVL